MDNQAKPWDQRPGEAGKAFQAFRTYLELGPARKILDTYRKIAGKPEAIQVPGSWNAWVRDHEWIERARAYDSSMAAEVDRAIVRTARGRGERLNVGLDRAIERAFAAGERMISRGMQWLEMPTTETEEVEEGKKYIIRPASPKVHRVGGMLVRDGLALIEHARDRVFQQMREEERSSAVASDGVDSRSKASRELDDWHAEQQRKIAEHQRRVMESHGLPASANGA